MKRIKFWRSLLLVLFAALLAGCNKKASEEIDFGTLKNSVYQNDYLGLAVTLPKDWSVQDQESKQRLTAAGSAALAGDDKHLQATLKAGELKIVNLFMVFKFPLGTPGSFNPAIIGMAERVRRQPGIKSGKDYLFQARKTFESGQLQVSFPKEIYTARLGGVDFDVMDMEMVIRGVTVKETQYAAIRKGYALSFAITYQNADQEAFERKVLDTVTLK
jgi:hypothetical protein